MGEVIDQNAGIIFIATVLVVLMYGVSGGVKAFCRHWNIELWDKRIQRLILYFVLSLTIMLVTCVSVFSGLFVELLGLAGLFAAAYVVVRLLMVATGKSGEDLRKL